MYRLQCFIKKSFQFVHTHSTKTGMKKSLRKITIIISITSFPYELKEDRFTFRNLQYLKCQIISVYHKY